MLTRLGNWEPHPSGVFPERGIYPPDIPLPVSGRNSTNTSNRTPGQQDLDGQVLDQSSGGSTGSTDTEVYTGGALLDDDGVAVDVATACRFASCFWPIFGWRMATFWGGPRGALCWRSAKLIRSTLPVAATVIQVLH